MRVHVESCCPEIERPDAPSPALVRGSQPGVLAPEGHLSLPPTPTPHLFQLFEIVCVKVKVFSNKLLIQ